VPFEKQQELTAGRDFGFGELGPEPIDLGMRLKARPGEA